MRGYATVESTRYRELDAAATLLDCLLRNIPGGAGGGATGPGVPPPLSSDTAAKDIVRGMEEICAALVSYKSAVSAHSCGRHIKELRSDSGGPLMLLQDALLQALRLRTLSFFQYLFRVNAAALRAVIDVLFQAVSFRTPAEAKVAWSDLTEDTRATRRRALFTLVVIAKKDPKLLFVCLCSQ
jgi:hypothetical protein